MTTETQQIKILGKSIPVSSDYLPISELKYLRDNPRVFSCIHQVKNFDNLSDYEQQHIIHKNLLKETSVKNLIPEIDKHGGLIEHILVRYDTKEVIEGNSRLAVFHYLHDKHPDNEEWELIPCQIVSRLSDEQQDALLNQIHVKGKTEWTPYEKANFAYVRYERGITVEDIAKRFGETPSEIEKRIDIINLMKKNNDSIKDHFSYYDVMIRNKAISEAFSKDNKLREFILNKVKELNNYNNDPNKDEFTALELRNKLPMIIKKPKVLKKYINNDFMFDEAYQLAKISDPHKKIKQATETISDISKNDIQKLERNEINALESDVRKLNNKVERIRDMVKQLKETPAP